MALPRNLTKRYKPVFMRLGIYTSRRHLSPSLTGRALIITEEVRIVSMPPAEDPLLRRRTPGLVFLDFPLVMDYQTVSGLDSQRNSYISFVSCEPHSAKRHSSW
jgi:hypothetical protein